MTNILASALATVSAVALALTLAVPRATAQAAQPRPVRVAVPLQFPNPDARALVVRYASDEKGDVIVLDVAGATPEAFAAALALLRHMRKSSPTAGQDVVATVTGFVPLGRPDARRFSQLVSTLERLRAQPLAQIGNLGPGRWVDIPDAAVSM